METLHPTGHTPTLFGTFANGHVYSYLEGEPVRSKGKAYEFHKFLLFFFPDELARHSRAIAEKVAVWHQQVVTISLLKKVIEMFVRKLKQISHQNYGK
jgi:hypothetical protein